MIFVALEEASRKGELFIVHGGMCRWHRRKDGTVVIREILVLPGQRRNGIGRSLVRRVQEVNPVGSRIIARCPAKYKDGNAFWKGMGFLLNFQDGTTNLWESRRLGEGDKGN